MTICSANAGKELCGSFSGLKPGARLQCSMLVTLRSRVNTNALCSLDRCLHQPFIYLRILHIDPSCIVLPRARSCMHLYACPIILPQWLYFQSITSTGVASIPPKACHRGSCSTSTSQCLLLLRPSGRVSSFCVMKRRYRSVHVRNNVSLLQP